MIALRTDNGRPVSTALKDINEINSGTRIHSSNAMTSQQKAKKKQFQVSPAPFQKIYCNRSKRVNLPSSVSR